MNNLQDTSMPASEPLPLAAHDVGNTGDVVAWTVHDGQLLAVLHERLGTEL